MVDACARFLFLGTDRVTIDSCYIALCGKVIRSLTTPQTPTFSFIASRCQGKDPPWVSIPAAKFIFNWSTKTLKPAE